MEVRSASFRGLELCRKCVLSFQPQRSHPRAAPRPAPNPFSLPGRGAVPQGSEGDLTYPCPKYPRGRIGPGPRSGHNECNRDFAPTDMRWSRAIPDECPSETSSELPATIYGELKDFTDKGGYCLRWRISVGGGDRGTAALACATFRAADYERQFRATLARLDTAGLASQGVSLNTTPHPGPPQPPSTPPSIAVP